MKRILLSLMMLCGASSLCHAQEVKFEYDEAGNLVKRYSTEIAEDYSLDDKYRLKITYTQRGKKINVKLYEGRSGNVVDCHIQVMIHPLYGSSTISITDTSEKGSFDVNISSLPSNIYSLVVLAYVNPQGAPLQKSIKFEKQW